MKIAIALVFCLVVISTTSNAEIFTKNNKTIKHDFIVEKSGNVIFDFKFKELTDQHWQPIITVYRQSRERYLYTSLDTGEESQIFYLPLMKGNYNVVLSQGQQYLNKPFDFKMTTEYGNFEQEPNNNFENATLINEGIFYSGYMQPNRSPDVDYFKFVKNETGVVELLFKHNAICKNRYFTVSILDESEKQYTELSTLTTSENDYRISNKPHLEKSPYYDLPFQLSDGLYKQTVELIKGTYFIKIETKITSSCISNKEYFIQYKRKSNIKATENIDTNSSKSLF